MKVSMAILVAALVPACGVDDSVATIEATSQCGGDSLDEQLARAADATEQYRDVACAISDGFGSTEECVVDPAGSGSMGIHFVNFARIDGIAMIEEPEALLYLPAGDHLRLVGIEYIVPIVIDGAPYMGCGVNVNSCPPDNPPPAPPLFDGIEFDGPMAGHVDGMPWHYDLHVWLYAQNPAGLFAAYNPAITCPRVEAPRPERLSPAQRSNFFLMP